MFFDFDFAFVFALFCFEELLIWLGAALQ